MRILLAAAFVVSLVLAAAPARAADPAVIGTVQEVEGTATVAGATAAVGTEVHENDLLATGAASRLLVLLIDDTELTLSENGRIVVDEFVFDDQDDTGNKARYSMLKGAFLYVSGLVAKKLNPDVAVATPMGNIGIRGTQFWGGDIDDGYGVLVTEGRVLFSNAGGEQELTPGLGLQLADRNAPLPPPKQWGQGKIDRAVATITLKNAEAARARVAAMKARHAELRAKYREHLKQRREGIKDDIKDRIEERRENIEEKRGQIEEKRGQMQERRENMERIQKQHMERRKDMKLRQQ